MCVCVCVCVYINIHIYVNTYIHIDVHIYISAGMRGIMSFLYFLIISVDYAAVQAIL